MPAVKHTVSNLQERKNYNFKCGIKAYQEECDYAQDKEILALLKSVEIGELKDFGELSIAKLIDKIIVNDLIGKLFNIILITEEVCEQNWDKLKRSEVIEVLQDFFTLSPVLQKWFGTGNSVVDTLLASLLKKKDSD